MSQFPINTAHGLYEAVNYLASGPSGLGQDFNGFTAYLPGYLTGNYRTPYTYITYQKTGLGVDGAANIQVQPDTTGLQLGQSVTGTFIGTNAKVTSISSDTALNPVTYTVNLSQPNSAKSSKGGDPVQFGPAVIPQNYVIINCNSAVQISDKVFQYNFANVQPAPPFQLGNNLYGQNFDNSFYNGYQTNGGATECTTSYVRFQTETPYPGTGNAGPGQVYFTITDGEFATTSTDCNSKVTTVSPTDRVFLSAQFNNAISYRGISGNNSDTLYYTVAVNRYVGELTASDPGNPIYRFNLDSTVSQKVYTRTVTGTGTLDEIETIFSTLVDNPPPGYYWYILEVGYATNNGNVAVTQSTLGVRSISTQVVKQ